MSERQHRRSIEAILMVVDEPVTEEVLAQILEIPTELVSETIKTMAASYEDEDRGFQLRAVAGGWRFYSHPDQSQIVEKLPTANRSQGHEFLQSGV